MSNIETITIKQTGYQRLNVTLVAGIVYVLQALDTDIYICAKTNAPTDDESGFFIPANKVIYYEHATGNNLYVKAPYGARINIAD